MTTRAAVAEAPAVAEGLRPEQIADPVASQYTAEQWTVIDESFALAWRALPDAVLDELAAAIAGEERAA